MKDKTLYTLHANICKALASPIRIGIIDVLNDSLEVCPTSTMIDCVNVVVWADKTVTF